MEVAIVLVKLIMDKRRREAREKADRAQKENRALRELLDKHDIEIPPDFTAPVKSTEPAR